MSREIIELNRPLRAWHFGGRVLGFGDGRVVRVGRRQRFCDAHYGRGLEMCKSGMHASIEILDALRYAAGDVIRRVELSGRAILDPDKVCAEYRQPLWANNSGLQIEEYIARQLGAEEYPNQEHLKPARRDRSGWSWYLRLAGVNMHISHKISVSKVFHYQSTPTARQLLNARLNNGLRRVLSKDEDSKLRVVIRAHAHYYNTVGYSGSDGYVLPCWKALDEWMLAGGPIEISPDIGYLGFHCEDGVWSYDKRLFHLEDVQPPPYTVIKPRNGNGRSRARSRAKASG